MPDLLLMVELLHDSMGSLSQSLQEFIHTHMVQDWADIMKNQFVHQISGSFLSSRCCFADEWRLSQWFRVRVILCSCSQDRCPYWLFVCSHCCCGEFLRLLAAIWKAGMALIVHDHPVGTCLLYYEGTLRSSGRIKDSCYGQAAGTLQALLLLVGNSWVLVLKPKRMRMYEAMFIEVVSERLVIFWRSSIFVVTFAMNTNQPLISLKYEWFSLASFGFPSICIGVN